MFLLQDNLFILASLNHFLHFENTINGNNTYFSLSSFTMPVFRLHSKFTIHQKKIASVRLKYFKDVSWIRWNIFQIYSVFSP